MRRRPAEVVTSRSSLPSEFDTLIVDAQVRSTMGSPSGRMAHGMLVRDWVWGEIPPGFTTVTDKRGRRLVVREDLEECLRTGTFFDQDDAGQSSPFQGRGRLRSARLSSGETALIRIYHHGGMFRTLTGKLFFSWPPRPFRELAITEELRRRGVPTVAVCGACVEPAWGPFYKGWLVTRELEGAGDLWTLLRDNFAREAGTDNVWLAVAGSLRLLHHEGVYHKDLNLKNILLRPESGSIKAYIIDFDKAALFLGRLPDRLAQKNLARLLRSVCKLDPERKYVSERDWNSFVASYHGTAV